MYSLMLYGNLLIGLHWLIMGLTVVLFALVLVGVVGYLFFYDEFKQRLKTSRQRLKKLGIITVTLYIVMILAAALLPTRNELLVMHMGQAGMQILDQIGIELDNLAKSLQED